MAIEITDSSISFIPSSVTRIQQVEMSGHRSESKPPFKVSVEASTEVRHDEPEGEDSSSDSDSVLPTSAFTLPPKTLQHLQLARRTPLPSRRGSPEPLQRSESLTHVRVTCHCRQSTMRVAFPTDSLPIPCFMCNCDACRHTSGQMAFHTVRIVGVPQWVGTNKAVPVHEVLKAYQPPERRGVTQYFCPACSAKVLVHVNVLENLQEEKPHLDPPNIQYQSSGGWPPRSRSTFGEEGVLNEGTEYWRVAGGALQQAEGVIQPVCHVHVSDTKDGGFAEQLLKVNDIDLVRYSGAIGSDQLPLGWRSPDLKEEQRDALSFYCHCRAISCTLSRPDEVIARLPTAPYPDLIFPKDTTRLAKARNIRDEKWWLRPSLAAGEPTRYLTGHCACGYCRLTSGFEIQSWAFVPRRHVQEVGSDDPICFTDAVRRPRGLKQYVASPGRYTEFCGTCGATCFWWTASRPEIIDISIGLIDQSQDGVRAEHWFDWHKDRVSFAENAKSPQLVAGLKEGMRAQREHVHSGNSSYSQ